ncbi:MAG: hypothetical protein LBM70_00605, partial [Victivallales bacterium]|nr:hypothetical protein [Victivallales bacterium]
MKILNDLSVFRWENLPKPDYYQGVESYHIRSRRSFRMRSVNVGSGGDDMIGTESFCEVQWLKGARYRRRNAPCLSVEYILKGEVFARQEDRGYLLEAGDFFLMQPRLESELLATPSGCHKISLTFVG